MMKKTVFLFVTLFVLCFSAMAQKDCALLPKPQEIEWKGGSFFIGKVKLVTDVLPEEWKAFITEAGGEVMDNSSRLIEVKLVPSVEGAKLNQEEAYRLTVSSKAIKIEAKQKKVLIGRCRHCVNCLPGKAMEVL